MCQGYYRHAEGYTPEWQGLQDFNGTIVRPQHWPQDLDFAGKRVVVIGSGATAATLIPNMAFVFGYLRTSWTMRVDLICDYVCKLLNHMDDLGARVCTPTLREQDQDMAVLPWVDEEEFNPGYMQRSVQLMPNSGDHELWTFSGDYYIEKDQLPLVDLDDDALVYL